jgi:hypothetical protein
MGTLFARGPSAGRGYLDDSGVLRTVLAAKQGEWTITDFMPAGPNAPAGAVCRLFSSPPGPASVLRPRPNYRRDPVELGVATERAAVINDRHILYSSHPLDVSDGKVTFTLPPGQEGGARWRTMTLPRLTARRSSVGSPLPSSIGATYFPAPPIPAHTSGRRGVPAHAQAPHRRILDAGLACANDLGLFAEEGDPQAGLMLGNFPSLRPFCVHRRGDRSQGAFTA